MQIKMSSLGVADAGMLRMMTSNMKSSENQIRKDVRADEQKAAKTVKSHLRK